jgi:hypothetical protein
VGRVSGSVEGCLRQVSNGQQESLMIAGSNSGSTYDCVPVRTVPERRKTAAVLKLKRQEFETEQTTTVNNQ